MGHDCTHFETKTSPVTEAMGFQTSPTADIFDFKNVNILKVNLMYLLARLCSNIICEWIQRHSLQNDFSSAMSAG